MNLPDSVRSYLDRQRFPYILIPYPANEALEQVGEKLDIPTRRIVRAVLLQDANGLLMAILPYSHILDFSLLCQLRELEPEPLYGNEALQFFQGRGCKGDSRPPLPAAFGLPALVDSSLPGEGELYFESGSGDSLIRMASRDFGSLLDQARWGQFSIPAEDLDFLTNQQTLTPQNLTSLTNRYTPTPARAGLESITELPAVPKTVQELLALQADPARSIQEVLRLAEQDASRAAQLVYWARAPLHGFNGAVDSLATAVERVLGPEKALALLIGSSMAQTFRMPVGGPVGLQAVWQHSIYCATLVGELVKLLPEPLGVNPGLAYLSGLLHDFGYLVLAQVLPARFYLLNRFLTVNRQVPINDAERHVMGVDHEHIGAWLMQSWNLPEEVYSAVRWHHGEDSTHPHAAYSNLVLIANRLLHYVGLGEEHNNRLPALAMFTLGLTREQALTAVGQVHASMAELENLCAVLPLPEES
ncbi:MAG TPA: HDOD domain-containing protein [Candidatus Competibacter sp.]|nr:hypothetical protein [Candidatus Competibacteraceae bacterium]HRE54834.1 HDOD domain-containing protein [Candidatus Competibacter sp.]HUM95663.1 HDOD domain-containing protein [Candidatus Competibacter sp.]